MPALSEMRVYDFSGRNYSLGCSHSGPEQCFPEDWRELSPKFPHLDQLSQGLRGRICVGVGKKGWAAGDQLGRWYLHVVGTLVTMS